MSVRDQSRARDEPARLRDVDAESVPAAAVPAAELLVSLQRTAGNHAVTRLVKSRRALARVKRPADMVAAQAAHAKAEEHHAEQSQTLKAWLAEGCDRPIPFSGTRVSGSPRATRSFTP